MKNAATYYKENFTNRSTYPTFEREIKVDVGIVGGGLAGLSVAIRLAEYGLSVAVLEQHHIGFGASGVNGGFVSAGYALDFNSIKKKVGLENANKLYQYSSQGVDIVRNNIKKYKILCNKVDGVVVGARISNEQDFLDEQNFCKKQLKLDSQFLSRTEVRKLFNSQVYRAGLLFTNFLTIDPLRYVYGLAKAIERKGGIIFENSKAISFKNSGLTKEIRTSRGRLSCSEIVVCGSVFLSDFMAKLESSLITVSTNILSKKYKKALIDDVITSKYGLYDDRYVLDYYRKLSDGTLLWGGRAAAIEIEKDRQSQLKHDIIKTYPKLKFDKADHYWIGLLGYGLDKMPQIGKLEGIWYSQGFGGHGINTTAIAGELIAKAIAKNDTSYKIFSSFKLSFAYGSMAKYLVNIIYNYHFMKDIYHTRLRR